MSIKLVNTNSSLVVVLSAVVTATEASIMVCGQDHVVGTSSTEFSTESTSNGASEVTISAAPGASTYRNINYISVYNADTASITITIKKKVNSVYTTLYKQTLLPGSTLEYTNGGWKVSDTANVTSYRLRQITTFTNTGANTWTKPSWCRAVRVRVQAGGGGSGYTTAGTGYVAATGGGGGGGYSEMFILAASLQSTETATIGAGGVAGTSGSTTGGTGGTSSFGSHCSATGGVGATPHNPNSTSAVGYGANGGAGVGGDINISGSPGATTVYNENTIWTLLPGIGGASHLGGGGNFDSVGSKYGGGAGGKTTYQASQNGSAGAQGIIIVEEYE